MKCAKCGAAIAEDARFCTHCGARAEHEPPMPVPEKVREPVAEPVQISQTDPQPPVPVQPEFLPTPVQQKKEGMAGRIVALIVGTILIIVGLVYVADASTSIYSTTFGADFYTYAYRGIVTISRQLVTLQECMGWIIAAIGAAIDVSALRK